MGQVDALKMVDHVRKRLVDMAVSENFIRDNKISDATRYVWSGSGPDGGLVSNLWVEGAFSGELSDDTLASLSNQGLFPDDLCHHLNTRDVFPANRRLYTHQSESIRSAMGDRTKKKQASIITAGTGLGKTEAFLLPLLADLWTAPARQKNGGMRSLILYPMNALVADQVARIYEWLKGQNQLSVFHFTSETWENARMANKRGETQWEPCRMRTRQEARGFENHDGKEIKTKPWGDVPDIVITNYSMLEYMLCRPQDARFFGPDLRSIILDEAHLYSGALATEIMMLLRRLRERCGVSPYEVRHIATSATLGGDEKELRTFGSSLFSTKETATKVIRGHYADHDPGTTESPPIQPTMATGLAPYSSHDFATLTATDALIEDDENSVNELRVIAQHLVSESTLDRAQKNHPSTPARFLFESLREAPLIRKMASILTNEIGRVISLDALTVRLFGDGNNNDNRDATIALMRLASVAKLSASDLPLVPHRLHFLVRAPEGLSVCLNPKCSGPDERRIPSIGCLQPFRDRCCYCDHILLPIHRCDNCGEWALAAYENQETSVLVPGYYAETPDQRTYYLLVRPKELSLEEVIIDSMAGEIRGSGAVGVSLWKAPQDSDEARTQRCPTCSSSWSISAENENQPEWRRICQSLVGGRHFALSVTAETVMHDLPYYHGTSHNWKPSHGRRLLAFSDSRASAARLGPLLTQQHEAQVLRAAMARCVNKLTPAGTADYLASEVERLEKEIAETGHSSSLKQHLEIELADKRTKLRQAKAGTPFIDFASLVAESPELSQIMNREMADRQNAESYGQSDWKKNGQEVKTHIEGMIAGELDRPLKKRATVESVGLIEVVYPGIESLWLPNLLEEKLPSKVRQKIAEEWSNFVVLLLDTIRTDSCVAWTEDTPGRTWLGVSPLVGRWLTRSRGGWGATAFVGATQRQTRRTFAANVLSAAGCEDKDLASLSEEILYAVFDQLFQLAGNTSQGFAWLQKEEHHQTRPEEDDKAIQILFDKLSIRDPERIFRCEATRTIWTHSALCWAPIDGCLGTLHVVAAEDLNKDARWGRSRREFMDSPIFSEGLWAEEHSAQLAPHENRRLQDLFKNGIRNILSSTTTMELGIDIGGLNGVLLGNVPPGPANHRQRAGRAGRRSDGSAVVVTYARDSEYDREVFRRFGEFLKRDLRKPTVFLERARIISRHLNATLLSEFLRPKQPGKTGAMPAFGKMGEFCGVGIAPPFWKDGSEPKPSWQPNGVNVANQFIDFLNHLKIRDDGYQDWLSRLSEHTIMSEKVQPDSWNEFIDSAIEMFRKGIGEWNNEIKQLSDAWRDIPARPTSNIGGERAKALQIRYMIRALCDKTVIEWLADHRFLPRYGFPINLQALSVRKAIEGKHREYSGPDERYNLERSSLLALSEYVPESRVLVGGRVATSRGLRKHWTDSNLDEALGLQYFSLECQEGHVYIRQSPKETCPKCGNNPEVQQQLVLPRWGYTTAGWENMPLGTNLERIGKQSVCPTSFTEHDEGFAIDDFADIPRARIVYREEANLLVRNAGKHRCGFAICTRCGFAMSELENGQGRINLPRNFESHASIFSSNPLSFCWEKGDQSAPVLRNRVLAARELTDMLLMEWPGATSNVHNGVYSLGRALMLAGTRLLELDGRELGMELMPLRNTNLGIVIYDTAPGGAGHCQELINLKRDWIDAARAILFLNDEHHARCKKACLDCILDFSGQYSAYKLDRPVALTLLDDAII